MLDTVRQPRLPHTHRAPEPEVNSKFRPDIEGLRAVAVLLVVLDHLTSWPKGGFVGVDVFFVISGFLITGLLLAESERRGRISFRRFYIRRARRILPASITLLVAVWIASHLAFTGSRVRETVTDIWWALGFSANIHFANVGTDYFQATRPPSPVQHFWSLAVEEQFYVVWPVVMLIVLTLIGRRLSTAHARGLLLAVVSAASLASFVYAILETNSAPAAAYFSTPARAWELGLGAIVAIVAVQFPGLPRRIRSIRGPLSALGLLGILVGSFTVGATHGFPAPGAALPVVSAALVIFAGLGGTPLKVWAAPLTNPLSRYIGRISYSLYLVHWPVIVIATALVPASEASSGYYYAAVTFAMAGLSMLSYHVVEQPLRTASFDLRPSAIRQALSRVRLGRLARRTEVIAAVCLSALAVIIWVAQPSAKVPDFVGRNIQHSLADKQLPLNVARPSPGLTTAIEAAVAATSWPSVKPSFDELSAEPAWADWAGCRGATEKTLAGCTFGPADAPRNKTAVVIGDSYAMAWMPAIKAALLPHGWRIYGLELESCPAANVQVDKEQNPPSLMSSCNAWHQWVVPEAQKLNPGLILLASSDRTLTRLHSKAKDAAAEAEYQAGMQSTIRALKPSSTRAIVTIAPPPTTPTFRVCRKPHSPPSDCVSQINDTWRRGVKAEADAAAKTKTAFVDTHLWFCSQDGYCPSFIGETLVRKDGHHLSPEYAQQLGPALKSVLDRAMGT